MKDPNTLEFISLILRCNLISLFEFIVANETHINHQDLGVFNQNLAPVQRDELLRPVDNKQGCWGLSYIA